MSDLTSCELDALPVPLDFGPVLKSATQTTAKRASKRSAGGRNARRCHQPEEELPTLVRKHPTVKHLYACERCHRWQWVPEKRLSLLWHDLDAEDRARIVKTHEDDRLTMSFRLELDEQVRAVECHASESAKNTLSSMIWCDQSGLALFKRIFIVAVEQNHPMVIDMEVIAAVDAVIQDFCASVMRLKQSRRLPTSVTLGTVICIIMLLWVIGSAWTWLASLGGALVGMHQLWRSLPPLDPRDFSVGSELWVQYREREHIRLMWMSATVRVFEMRLIRILERRRRQARQAEVARRQQQQPELEQKQQQQELHQQEQQQHQRLERELQQQEEQLQQRQQEEQQQQQFQLQQQQLQKQLQQQRKQDELLQRQQQQQLQREQEQLQLRQQQEQQEQLSQQSRQPPREQAGQSLPPVRDDAECRRDPSTASAENVADALPKRKSVPQRRQARRKRSGMQLGEGVEADTEEKDAVASVRQPLLPAADSEAVLSAPDAAEECLEALAQIDCTLPEGAPAAAPTVADTTDQELSALQAAWFAEDDGEESFNEEGGDEIDAEFARRVQEHFQTRVQAAGKDLHSQTQRGNQILKTLCEKLKTELERNAVPK